VDLLDNLLAALQGALAGHYRQQQAMLGVDGGVVPAVAQLIIGGV
jgi:hypothetical protein